MALPLQTTVRGVRFEALCPAAPDPARGIRTRVETALQHGYRDVVIDCESWDRLDFGVLSALIQCASACRAHGASLEIANLSPQIRADVRALQLHHRLGLAD
jgi:anti-anti-sigma regulatory factor